MVCLALAFLFLVLWALVLHFTATVQPDVTAVCAGVDARCPADGETEDNHLQAKPPPLQTSLNGREALVS